ncbi:DNA-binding protein [Nitrincola alkalilacustris]|uniref:DNA-binding protein n=1 Tax=Nitrincola alkalilacustris TaxID=1571224 RepID=UPI00124C7DB2|nr:DNA-binding protein [Nitrincola alkalilacustris]
MDIETIRVQVFEVADQLLLSGQYPDVAVIASRLRISPEEITQSLDEWWKALPERVNIKGDHHFEIPGMPDVLAQAFTRVWQQAVQEAQSHVILSRKKLDVGEEEDRRVNDDAVQKSHNLYVELEARYRDLQLKLEESREQSRVLDAELTVLKGNLANETNHRKKEEQKRSTLEHELAQLRKVHDDAKRVFDQRIKEEQRHMLEALAKEEVETRFYRNALEKAREEASKRESEFTREAHDLQTRLARRDVNVDTLKSQTKGMEAELQKFKQEAASQQRELSKLNNQLLAELNKTKRLEQKVRELQEESRRTNQKLLSQSNESAKRENALRLQLKDKEDNLIRAEAKVNSLEKRMISYEEEVRRLSSRI